MRNVGKSKAFQNFICFFNICIICIELSTSVGQAAGLGVMGLVLENSIYHPSDLCLICDLPWMWIINIPANCV
jgi:hypothetical protein